MDNNQQKPEEVKVIPKYLVKVIVTDKQEELEKLTNKFLETMSSELILKNISFSVNQKTGEMIHIIHYTELSPMTKEEWIKRIEISKKFASGFKPEELETEVTKL